MFCQQNRELQGGAFHSQRSHAIEPRLSTHSVQSSDNRQSFAISDEPESPNPASHEVKQYKESELFEQPGLPPTQSSSTNHGHGSGRTGEPRHSGRRQDQERGRIVWENDGRNNGQECLRSFRRTWGMAGNRSTHLRSW